MNISGVDVVEKELRARRVVNTLPDRYFYEYCGVTMYDALLNDFQDVFSFHENVQYFPRRAGE